MMKVSFRFPKKNIIIFLFLIIAWLTTSYYLFNATYSFLSDSNDYIIRLKQFSLYINYAIEYADYAKTDRFSYISSTIINKKITQKNSTKIVPVLLYHGIINKPDGTNILLADFKKQLFALKKDGYQTITINDYYQFIQGNKQLPPKSFLLTFDDGRKDSYYNADPILKALNYNAVMFVITKYSMNNNSHFYLSLSELKEMNNTGRWELEAHTKNGHDMVKISKTGKMGYFYSNKLWLDKENRLETKQEYENRIKNDLLSAKNDLEQKLHIKVIAFAFPFGDYGQDTLNFVDSQKIVLKNVSSIYDLAFYQAWPFNESNISNSKNFLSKRIDITLDWGSNYLLQLLRQIKYIKTPYKTNFNTGNNGWLRGWGGMDIKNGSMRLFTTDQVTDSIVILTTSYFLDNINFNATVNLKKGTAFVLIARLKNGTNYLECAYSDKLSQINQMTDGEFTNITNIATQKPIRIEYGMDYNPSVRINKNNIQCLLNGDIVASSNAINPILNYGQIGFKVWDPKVNNSELVIKNVDVKIIEN